MAKSAAAVSNALLKKSAVGFSLQYLAFQNELTSEVEKEEDIDSGQTGDDVMSGEITNTCEEENIDAVKVDFTSSVCQNTCSQKELDDL